MSLEVEHKVHLSDFRVREWGIHEWRIRYFQSCSIFPKSCPGRTFSSAG